MDTMTVHDVRTMLMEEGGASSPEAAEQAPGRTGDGRLGGKAGRADESPAEGAPVPGDAPEQEGALPEEAQRSYVEGSVGLGVDIVEIDRMRGILERRPQFAEQVFSQEECAYCDAKADPATHYALRFAAKEAVVKALGTGFAEGIWVHDIEVERTAKGRPTVKLSGRALEVAEEQGVRELSLSLSYTRTDAVACALAITESSVRATEKRKDPMEELARQFKETRKMLDDL